MAYNASNKSAVKPQSLKPHAAQAKADSALIEVTISPNIDDVPTKPSVAVIETDPKAPKPKRSRPTIKSKAKLLDEPVGKVMLTMRLDKGLYIALVDVAKSLSENKVVSVQSVLQQLAEDCVRKNQRSL